MSGPIAFDDPTLARWRAEQAKKDQQRADEQKQRDRVKEGLTELEHAFSEVRRGIPDLGDYEQSARAYAASWARIPPLLSKNSDLVHRRLDAMYAEPHSAKAYALRFVRTALADEAGAAKLLPASWEASKEAHSHVLYWLTGGLELEIMGENARVRPVKPLSMQDTSEAEQRASASAPERHMHGSANEPITSIRTDDNSDVAATQSKQRLQFDPQTQTIILDKTPYKIADPKAYAVYEAIASFCPKPLTKAMLQERIPGCKGGKKIRQLLDSLPKQLGKTVSSSPIGYWLDLNPLPKRRKTHRRKKGRT